MCLMSLAKSEAVPVDTHVWQIAKRDYSCAAGNGQKTLTDKVYNEIGELNNQHADLTILHLSISLYLEG